MDPTTHEAGCTCSKASCACQTDEHRSRRQFLRKVTTVAIGSLSLTFLPAVSGDELDDGSPSSQAGEPASNGRMPLFGFLVDTEKCIGAGKCLTACRVENDVPEGYQRTWVEHYVHFKDGTVQVDLLPETGLAGSDAAAIDADLVDRATSCPSCATIVKTRRATRSARCTPRSLRRKDSSWSIRTDASAAPYCVQACPYGVRFINPVTGTADKCTWCYHRVKRGQAPACVEACPVGARVFGRLDDPDSEISKRIAELPTSVLKQYLGTHPKTRYVGISEEVT